MHQVIHPKSVLRFKNQGRLVSKTTQMFLTAYWYPLPPLIYLVQLEELINSDVWSQQINNVNFSTNNRLIFYEHLLNCVTVNSSRIKLLYLRESIQLYQYIRRLLSMEYYIKCLLIWFSGCYLKLCGFIIDEPNGLNFVHYISAARKSQRVARLVSHHHQLARLSLNRSMLGQALRD